MDFDVLASELVTAIRGEMSQSSLNRRLGLRGNQVRRWESGERRISWRDFVRVCEIRGVDLQLAMRSMCPLSGLLDMAALIKRVIGAAPLTDVARKTGISRFTLMRWLKGEGSVALADILNLIQNNQFTLFELLRNLVNVEELPSVHQEFLERQGRKRVYYRRPEVAAILCCLMLDDYRNGEHRPGFIAEKIGISLENEIAALDDLLEVGKISWDGKRYVPIAEHLELTDSRDFNVFCRYWFQRAMEYLEELPNPHPTINYGMDIQPASAATVQKIKDEYKQFYRRVRSLMMEDKGPKDQVYVFNALFFDLEKRHAETQPYQLWMPIKQPTNHKETEENHHHADH